MADESIISTQSQVRRGTLYKKPGPPTPSKMGGRLSFGGGVGIGDLIPKDILQEQNSKVVHNSGGASSNTNKKSTPSKFKSMFSSSKVKDEVSIFFNFFDIICFFDYL